MQCSRGLPGEKAHLGPIQKHKSRQHTPSAISCLPLQDAKEKTDFLLLTITVCFLSTRRRAVSRDSHQYSHLVLMSDNPLPAIIQAQWYPEAVAWPSCPPISCSPKHKVTVIRHSAFQCWFLRHARQLSSNVNIYSGILNTNMNKQRQFLFFSPLFKKTVNANIKITAQCQCKHWSKEWFKADSFLTTHAFSYWVHMRITIHKLHALASDLLLHELQTALPCQKVLGSPGRHITKFFACMFPQMESPFL